jgi:50S ribosomal protein 6
MSPVTALLAGTAVPPARDIHPSVGFPLPGCGGRAALAVECSSRPQKKGTKHHMKTRPKKTAPWDIKRRPTQYPPPPPLPPDWTLVAAEAPQEAPALQLAAADWGGDDVSNPTVFCSLSTRSLYVVLISDYCYYYYLPLLPPPSSVIMKSLESLNLVQWLFQFSALMLNDFLVPCGHGYADYSWS